MRVQTLKANMGDVDARRSSGCDRSPAFTAGGRGCEDGAVNCGLDRRVHGTPRPAERAAARVGVFKAAPPLPAVIRAAQRTGGAAADGSDDESAVCFAPRQRMPPPMDSRSDPRSRSPDNDVL